MTTYDRTFEYRADFDGHEFAGHIVAANMGQALAKLEDDRLYEVDVRLLAEVKRTTCCQRGDWSGADHQPAEAWLYVPIIRNAPFFRGDRRVVFLPDTTEAYRWSCEYCGRTGTRAELNGEA